MDQTSGYRTEGFSGLVTPSSFSGVYPPQTMLIRLFPPLAAPPVVSPVWNPGLAMRGGPLPCGRIGLVIRGFLSPSPSRQAVCD
eukprot:14274206-Heterocapsa_arctica.AAC.1